MLDTQGKVLIFLAQHPESSMTQIADAIGASKATAVATTKALVSDGFLARTNRNGKFHYALDAERVRAHGEIKALLEVLTP